MVAASASVSASATIETLAAEPKAPPLPMAAAKQVQFPHFCIIGAQKAGTTSMYDLLCQHPLITPATRKEPHFLDWRWNPAGCEEGPLASCAPPRDTDTAPADTEGLRRQWCAYSNIPLLGSAPGMISGEATPSYLLGGDLVVRRMASLAPSTVRLIVMLRDPVERCYSHYRMCADQRGSDEQLRNRGHQYVQGKSFADVVAEDIAELSTAGVEAPSEDETSAAEAFERYIAPKQALTHGAHSFVGRGLYAVQLLPWLAQFPRDQLHVVLLEEMNSAEGALATAEAVFKFVGLETAPEVLEGLDASPSNARAAACPIDEGSRRMLEDFYAPHHAALERILGRSLPFGTTAAAAPDAPPD